MQWPTAGCSCLPKCFKAFDSGANLHKTALLRQRLTLYCPNHYGLWMHLCKSILRLSPKRTSIIVNPTASEFGWFWQEAIKLLHASTGSNIKLLNAAIMTICRLTKREAIKKRKQLHVSIFRRLECSAQWSVSREVLAIDIWSCVIIIIHSLSALAFVIQNNCNCCQHKGGGAL